MIRPPVIADLQEALAQRLFPTVTVWNRLEGRPRTTEFDRALRAEVRDPLWMLARQWQFGEFRGEDTGSPISATYHVRTTTPTHYRPQDSPLVDLDPAKPLEATVEARTVPFTIGVNRVGLDLRTAMGRRWAKLMSGLPAAVRTKITARWPIAQPDPAADADVPLVAHPDVWAATQAVGGRILDGYDLYEHLKGGGHAHDGVTGLTADQKRQLDDLVGRFLGWFDDLITQPSGPPAYNPAQLDHRFSLEADGTVLTADRYPGGALDWHAFSSNGVAAPQAEVTRTVVPGEVRYSGMPNSRWWAFEDGSANFGATSADSTDLVKGLFLEFALVFGDDWFLLPVDLDRGSLGQVDGVVVTDVFGHRTWVEPAGDAWQNWSMFNLTGSDHGVFLPPSVPGTEGAPVEDVLLVRDEAANLVWGIERTVWLSTGLPMPGEEAARETVGYRSQRHPAPDPLTPVAAVRYQAMNTVPENWIPFISVHVPGQSRETQLQRGAMPRFTDGQVAKVQPRTTILRPGLDDGQGYFVHEEEISRAGTRVSVAFNRARWYDGRPVVWLGARRASGRGEASSGLDWDRLVDTP